MSNTYKSIKELFPSVFNSKDQQVQAMLEAFAPLYNELIDIETDAVAIAQAQYDEANSNETNNGKKALFQSPLPTQPIALIVGHTEKAKGAYSPHFGSSEYDFWRIHADYIRDYLRELGFKAEVFNRNKGTSKAYAAADKLNPLFTAELHFNAASDPTAHGFETLYLNSSMKGDTIAKYFASYYGETTEIEPRRGTGLKSLYHSDNPNTSRGMYNLSLAKAPSVLFEPFFGTNKGDCQNFDIEAFTLAIANTAYAYWKNVS